MASSYNNQNNPQKNDLTSWIITIILLGAVPPLGVLLLFLKLFSGVGNTRRGRHPYYQQQEHPGARTGSGTSYNYNYATPVQSTTSTRQPAAKKQPDKKGKARRDNPGRGLIIAGGILAGIFGFASIMELVDLLSWGAKLSWIASEMVPLLCFTAGGAGMLWAGLNKRKKARRFRKYLSLIGTNKTISISALAAAMPASPSKVRKELEDMLDEGYFPAGYLDYGEDELVLSSEGLRDVPPPAPAPEPEKTANTMEEKDAILAEIRAVNDAIAHPELSAQIDRIEEITGKIFDYQRSHPQKAPQLRSFLNYYLPTTLKILHAYARLESQGVEGENITAAKARIEAMMSKVVEGFEKQLDQLFQDDAMDITTDVAVLEKMLSKDGLSTDSGMQLGI